MGLVVDVADVNNLIEEHREECKTYNFRKLEAMQLISIQEELHSNDSIEAGGTKHKSSTGKRDTISWFENLSRFKA